jgi:hypothetical protein
MHQTLKPSLWDFSTREGFTDCNTKRRPHYRITLGEICCSIVGKLKFIILLSNQIELITFLCFINVLERRLTRLIAGKNWRFACGVGNDEQMNIPNEAYARRAGNKTPQ